MSKWIDADALIAELNERGIKYRADINEAITKAPSIDIVRCKECKHYFSDGGAMMFCENTDFPTNADDFCSYGERKGEE